MPSVIVGPPHTEEEPVIEIMHGVAVTDPYRWLEDQKSARTREWIHEQTSYSRAYLDSVPGRDRIRARIREFLTIDSYDSLIGAGEYYFFRKRTGDHEQPSIYRRKGIDGADELLVDPAERAAGSHTAVKPTLVSPNGNLLLYEIKHGGERSGSFELLDVASRKPLPDRIPRGFLRGFAFAPDSKSFYYVHEPLVPLTQSCYHVKRHVLGDSFEHDSMIFAADETQCSRLGLAPFGGQMLIVVRRFLGPYMTDYYLQSFDSAGKAVRLFEKIDYLLGLRMVKDRILAITDRDAPNRRIVEIHLQESGDHEFVDVVPESEFVIRQCQLLGNHIAVIYAAGATQQIKIFDYSGRQIEQVRTPPERTTYVLGGTETGDGLLLQEESFLEPPQIVRYTIADKKRTLWAESHAPIQPLDYSSTQVWYESKDGTRVPMFLVGKTGVLNGAGNPTILTSYGGFGTSMTPQFSVFVSFLMEHGCLFALPNIRGGCEFGSDWHKAAKGPKRQIAIDDFLAAAEWLLESGRTAPNRLAIFGGSNSGLLVGAALTQRPDLFQAVVCIAPLLDMLRYHHFDGAIKWRKEFGTADDPTEFLSLYGYSPYHRTKPGTPYPAVMLVSGDADQTCNPLHARKMTARLQSASTSGQPIILDYSQHRGHVPVLPLTMRIDALSDRMAFLCDQMGLHV